MTTNFTMRSSQWIAAGRSFQQPRHLGRDIIRQAWLTLPHAS
ncbi:hypothetical protein ACWD3Z_37385 [Streptomyces sp. NPDC002740]